MRPLINRVEVTGRFRYLWLKYITGVDLDHHCAKGLIGQYSARINSEMISAGQICLDEHPAEYYYLCGVAKPYKWENNFHLAFRYKPGSVFSVSRHGISIDISDAEEIPILVDSSLRVNHRNLTKPQYSTCRNWQFANWIYERENADSKG